MPANRTIPQHLKDEDWPDWPFAWEAAARLLDIELIQKQGDFFLRRGLSIRRLIAFVGSGASMAYGRVSWGELAETQVSGIIEAIGTTDGNGAVANLIRQLEALRDGVKAEKPEAIILALQLAEQVWMLADEKSLERLRDEFCPVHGSSDGAGTSSDEQGLPPVKTESQRYEIEAFRTEENSRKDLFRKSIKAETFDETHHIRRIFSDPFRDPRKDGKEKGDKIHQQARRRFTHGTLRRAPHGRRRSFASLFSKTLLNEIITAFGAPIAESRDQAIKPGTSSERLMQLSEAAARALQAECERSRREALNPFNYSAFGLVLDSARAVGRLTVPGREELNDRCRSIFAIIERALIHRKDAEPVRRERTEFIARDKDPLWHLAMTLDIKRFLTTNYDLEIERLIDDIGFEQTSYSAQQHIDRERIEQIGPLGGRAREIVLDNDNSAELLDFASSPGPYSIQVVHLHGRATDTEDIVLTERDYQTKYLGDEPHKIVAREGLDVLFGGNPILFIGVSLSEGDVVRPLREFASSLSRRNHSVVALMAATKDGPGRDSFVMEQYIRHGIYVLHYGKCKASGECWLENLFSYTAKLTELLDLLASQKMTPGELRAKKSAAAEARAGARLDLDSLDDISNRFGKFESDGASCSIVLEYQLLHVIWRFLDADSGALRSDLGEDLAGRFYGKVLRRAVKRIEGAIHTAALTSYLRGLEQRWRERAELRPPYHTRLDDLRFSTLADWSRATSDEDARFRKTRWFRHLVREDRREADRSVALSTASASDVVATHRAVGDEASQARRTGGAEVGEILAAWRSRHRSKSEPEQSRPRILIIAAPRGAGKGRLHEIVTKKGDYLLDGAGSESRSAEPPQKRYAAQFSASFSFSSEIASVWDGLAAFLINPDREARDTVSSEEWSAATGRIERIRFCLENLSRRLEARAGSAEKRVLVILQSFDFLFEPSGDVKNAEIRAICDILLDPRSTAPIDFVLIVRDTRIPCYFRMGKETQKSGPGAVPATGRVLRLLMAPDERSMSRDRARISRAIERADVGIDTINDDTARRLFGKLLPEAHQGGSADPTYIFFCAPPRSAAASSDKIGYDGLLINEVDQALELLRRNRFHLDLFERIITASDISQESREPIARDMVDATGREGRISSDRFFERILDYWAARPFDPRRDSDALKKEIADRQHAAVDIGEDVIKHAHDVRLQELLLRHLAVISQPVEADILARCPEVSKRVGILCRKPSDDEESVAHRKRIVECGLTLLSSRGLCFTIYGRHPAPDRVIRLRYQIHRALQLHIHRRLGAQNAEPPEGYFFSLSLYASQGRDLPLLSANAYAFLHDLMNELIGFPRNDGRFPPGRADIDHHARCLRAAIGVARTLFSIGVVARFNDLGGVNVPLPPRPGYFEHHRLTLRWMIREARLLAKARTDGLAKRKPIDEWMPYYPDELAWLYNESGVFSLAQGQSFDALAMFDLALRVAKRIEGEGDQPIRRRIMLNLAACAINRGRPNEARRLLEEIASSRHEDGVVLLVSEGYLGSLEHIEGDHDAALVHYEKAIGGLTRLNRSRALSLFLRYRGDLYRHKRDFERADHDFANAIDRARLSGSEDMAWFAIVARARMEIATETDFKSVIRKLEGAERYAEAMELPQLTAEVSFVHAQILLRQGETALAGERATRALRIATLNGLAIRAIAYRSLLSDIHRARGWDALAYKIKANALQAARDAGYRLLLQRHPTDRSPDDDDDRIAYPRWLSTMQRH
jgi:tetratricopeptide (TPR) repeat protein